MTLSTGTRLGPYEILSRLGSGGMGEVWRARDTRLDREVAIKLLSGEMAGPEALERFKREAKAASALNHPHICAIHDIGESDGRPFLVMERMKGETLREGDRRKADAGATRPASWARRSPMRWRRRTGRASSTGTSSRQTSSSPSDGDAKLLDFGLAKVGAAATGPIETGVATAVAEEHLTSPGSTLGTVAYMSPEQARGDVLDARTRSLLARCRPVRDGNGAAAVCGKNVG